jgi:hypothetical protein
VKESISTSRFEPSANEIQIAFASLGTHKRVASSFGFSRRKLARLLVKYNLEVVSEPHVFYANQTRVYLQDKIERARLAQWIIDEGSISVNFDSQRNRTILVISGSMNDFDAIALIARIVHKPLTTSKPPEPRVLPHMKIRLESARAYAALEVLLDFLVGLKHLEAEAALRFFSPSGRVKGRHTTDEFLLPAWKEFATKTLTAWNSLKEFPLAARKLESYANSWLQGRIARSRRFVSGTSSKLGSSAQQKD